MRFPLVDEPGTSLLVWTTTPWTLPGNVAVAAHPDEEYVKIERKSDENGTERMILGKALLEKVFGDEESGAVVLQGQEAERHSLPAAVHFPSRG